MVPLLRKCSLAGHAEFKTRDAVFSDNDVAPDMLLDVLSDRGFSGSHVTNERIIPAKVRSLRRRVLSSLGWPPGHIRLCDSMAVCLHAGLSVSACARMM